MHRKNEHSRAVQPYVGPAFVLSGTVEIDQRVNIQSRIAKNAFSVCDF